ncbi:MAG TPA: dihydrolipoamide acetyltransferase family protein [Atribacteraceae bacterium]|nr:dihydrolipoamide acetyltransferase family protein [Atribacteraceae bacterium]
MASGIKVPSVGQTTSEFQMLAWRKSVGESVKKGEVLFEIETDKAVLEVESFREGHLLTILAPVGSLVNTGQVVAYVGELGEVLPEEGDERKVSPSAEPIQKKDETTSGGLVPLSGKRILASPAARKLAREKGISLASLIPENGQTVKKRDVSTASLPADPALPFTDIPLTDFRRLIARRMTQSQRDIPQFTLEVSLDMTDLETYRKNLNDRRRDGEAWISLNDCLVVALSRAVREVPAVNARFQGESIRVFHEVNVGFAVATERGLLVPVLRGAEKMTLRQVAGQRVQLVEQGRLGKLTPANLSGATITLSNLGAWGIDRFTALINPPETAILAVGQVTERLVSREGKPVSRLTVFLTGSFDHRVIDGSDAARFMRQIKILVENPTDFLS